MTDVVRKSKLIEVALPLDEINAACKAYKDRKVGTIRNIHKWFAAMPLPAWRALLFAALIDDPETDNQRIYLLDVIKRLVANGADLPDVDTLEEAKALLCKQFPDGLPAVMDPFCGGGSTLVEAQRLGLSTVASDLNPVPVLISRTLTDLLPKVMGQAPIALTAETAASNELFPMSSSAPIAFAGLNADVSKYSQRVVARARASLASRYTSFAGEAPIAWLWARTTKCPNPACGLETFLMTSLWICKKKGDLAWFVPQVTKGEIVLEVVSRQKSGEPPLSPKSGRGAVFRCLSCDGTLTEDWIIERGSRHEIGERLVCVVAETTNGRIYRAPSDSEIRAGAEVPDVVDFPDVPLPDIPRWFSGPRFGFTTQQDLYTPRQRLVLATFADLIAEVYSEVIEDGGSRDWAAAVTTLMGLALGKMAQANSRQVRWNTAVSGAPKAEPAFGQNDMPMLWDFVETYPFGSSVGSFLGIIKDQARAARYVVKGEGVAVRKDARDVAADRPTLIATDPPYFDAIGYADLSDYFYLWHRRALRHVHPDLYMTVAVPKTGELTAVPAHHNNSASAAKSYFIEGFTQTFNALKDALGEDLPLIVVYASKEQKGGAGEETRWSSILSAIVAAELEITGTWPIHGATVARLIGNQTNAIASYIVMVCRPRLADAQTCSLAEFNRALRRELPPAVRDLQAASILPVDLNQAALGPGMRIYSRYRAVLDQSGAVVPVDQAIRLIDVARSEVLEEQEGDLDPESRFAVRWWETFGWAVASFDEAGKAARPLGISVEEVARVQVVTSRANKVQLLGADQLDRSWTPSDDVRPTAWKAVHHLADRLIDGGGELEAAQLMAVLGKLQESSRALVYRLHDIAAKKGRKADQERYNALINSWTELVRLASGQTGMAEGLF